MTEIGEPIGEFGNDEKPLQSLGMSAKEIQPQSKGPASPIELFPTIFPHIPEELFTRHLMQQIPGKGKNGEFLVVDLSNPTVGASLERDNLKKIAHLFDLNQPGERKYAAIFFVSNHPIDLDKIPEGLFSLYRGLLNRQDPKRDKNKARIGEEKCGAIFGYEEGGNDRNVELRKEKLVEAGFVKVNVLPGRSSKNPMIWEARIPKEAEQDGKLANDIVEECRAKIDNDETIDEHKNYLAFLEEGNRALREDNPDVEEIDDSRILSRMVKDYRRFKYDLLNGLDRDITFTCGTKIRISGREKNIRQDILQHCGDKECAHETGTSSFHDSFTALVGEGESSRQIQHQYKREQNKGPYKSRMGTIEEEAVRKAVLEPGFSHPTAHVCFECKDEHIRFPAKLSYKEFTVEDGNGGYKHFVAASCPTHGKRLTYKAPSVQQVRDWEARHKKNSQT